MQRQSISFSPEEKREAKIAVDKVILKLRSRSTTLLFQMNPPPDSDSGDDKCGFEDNEFWTLSGNKPYFSVILTKTHLHPHYSLYIPAKMHTILPSATIPVVLDYRSKQWNMLYIGRTKRLDFLWRKFAHDNALKMGDACVFQLEECNRKRLGFRVQILSGDIPPEILPKIIGESEDCPVVIA